MEMKRAVRLIILTNDAFGLAAGGFIFPIFKWDATSETQQSVSSLMKNKSWMLRVKTIQELVGLDPNEKKYFTLHEAMTGLPRGYSWKIRECLALFEDQGSVHLLHFIRDTIHKSYSTEPGFQSFILFRIKDFWNLCQEHYKNFSEIEMQRFRPSILVLEAIDGQEELASNEDLLYNIRSKLWSEENPLSKQMCEIVWRVEKKRGTWEYVPYQT